MGARGKAPKPTALKVLEGGRPDRINHSEPKPPDAEVVAPEWLSLDAREVWDRLAPSLVERRVLTPWDVDAFATLCSVFVQSRNAHRNLAENGITIDGRKNPAWQVAREAAGMIVSLGGRFGLNPSDRSQLSIEPEANDAKGKERLLS